MLALAISSRLVSYHTSQGPLKEKYPLVKTNTAIHSADNIPAEARARYLPKQGEGKLR